jgi:hypothetical protein
VPLGIVTSCDPSCDEKNEYAVEIVSCSIVLCSIEQTLKVSRTGGEK